MARVRQSNINKPVGNRGLILCEGETEEFYFKGLITEPENRRKFQAVSVEIFKPKDHSPLGLVKEAKRRANQAKRDRIPYDFIWVIFDRDGHASIPDAFEQARTSNPVVQIVYSVPCFEYFVLLHFEKTTKEFGKCDDIISYLKNKYIANYEKATDIFSILKPSMETGLDNCDWLYKRCIDDLNEGKRPYQISPYCNVQDLVRCLLKSIQ